MTEGEIPDIPQHLKDTVISVEAYEQQERRKFQIRDYARKLQIPQESMETNATVDLYIAVLRDADAGFERLLGARTDKITMDEGVRVRIGQAAALYHAEKIILEEGFPIWDEARRIDLDPRRGTHSLTGLLDRAARPLGWY